jgi:hypothetical protein
VAGVDGRAGLGRRQLAQVAHARVDVSVAARIPHGGARPFCFSFLSPGLPQQLTRPPPPPPPPPSTKTKTNKQTNNDREGYTLEGTKKQGISPKRRAKLLAKARESATAAAAKS